MIELAYETFHAYKIFWNLSTEILNIFKVIKFYLANEQVLVVEMPSVKFGRLASRVFNANTDLKVGR